MSLKKTIEISTIDGHKMAVDLFLPEMAPIGEKIPVTVFCHGFKGFKNWGFIPHLHDYLVTEKRALITFNHSHNGVKEVDFDELEKFADNSVGQELRDLESLAQWIASEEGDGYCLHPEKIDWIGHSRGGGNVILFSHLFPDWVRKVVTWAAIDSYEHIFRSIDLNEWKEKGQVFIRNARTKQDMPLNLSIYEEYSQHKERYTILEAARKMDKPLLIIHGKRDESVPFLAAENISKACKHAICIPVEDQGHTFGISHPMEHLGEAPAQFWDVLENTKEFLEEAPEDYYLD